MSVSRPSLCISCGRDAGAGSTINRFPDGRQCPTCAERLLDRIPPPFPGFGHLVDAPAAPRAEHDGSKRPHLRSVPAKKARRARRRRGH